MERLFVYGTLQLGKPNEHVLTAIGGEWEPAIIKGNLINSGWGSSMGYPGLVLDESGEDVQGHIFSSADLSAKWAELDAFEGEDYDRVLTSMTLRSGAQVQAYIYVLRADDAEL
ncbi:MAG: gamma-glutamylcyclotransferase [Leptolyngbyaceae cyanobacterium]